MSIKFHHNAAAVASGADVAPFAVAAPRPTDIISGALCRAFATHDEELDFDVLIARIDQADRANRTVSLYRGRG